MDKKINNNNSNVFKTNDLWNKDIQFGNNNSNPNEKKYNSIISYISSIQEISVQEKNLDNMLDKNLFTLQRSLQGFFCGIKVGFIKLFLLLLMYVCQIMVCLEIYRNSFLNTSLLKMIIIYFPIVLVISFIFYISQIGKYAVGNFTNKAIKIFYLGDFFINIVFGVFILYCYDNILQYSKIIFINDETLLMILKLSLKMYFLNFLIIFIAIFFPILFYILRKIFFTENKINEYDRY